MGSLVALPDDVMMVLEPFYDVRQGEDGCAIVGTEGRTIFELANERFECRTIDLIGSQDGLSPTKGGSSNYLSGATARLVRVAMSLS